MEQKWTNGPWTATNGNLTRVMKGTDCIAGVYRLGISTGRYSPETVEANAHLIASAPDLYDALKAVVHEMRRSHDGGDSHFSTDEVEAAERALAKAEGKTE